MVEKSNYHHGDLRQALIDGAIALIAEQDISSLSLREVARRVGVSHAAPYRHFADKEALLAAVAEEGFIRLTASMRQQQQMVSDDPLQRLQATGVGYVKFAIAHPSYYRVMFGTFQKEESPHPKQARVGYQAFEVLLNAIRAGQQAGAVRSGDTFQLALVAWSAVHGLAMLLIDGCLPIAPTEAENLAGFVTQTLTEGFAA